MRQQNSKATVPLDVVPERRTKRCSLRFRPGGRFWSQVSDTCRQAGRERNDDAPRDFGPEVAFGVKFQIPVARQAGREMSAPRPFVTEPFRPLSSINNW